MHTRLGIVERILNKSKSRESEGKGRKKQLCRSTNRRKIAKRRDVELAGQNRRKLRIGSGYPPKLVSNQSDREYSCRSRGNPLNSEVAKGENFEVVQPLGGSSKLCLHTLLLTKAN